MLRNYVTTNYIFTNTFIYVTQLSQRWQHLAHEGSYVFMAFSGPNTCGRNSQLIWVKIHPCLPITYTHTCWLPSLERLGSSSKTMRHITQLEMSVTSWKSMTKTSKYYSDLHWAFVGSRSSVCSMDPSPRILQQGLQIPVTTCLLTESLPASLLAVHAAHGDHSKH